MSLITEALRKAQQMRGPGSPMPGRGATGGPGQPWPTPARRGVFGWLLVVLLVLVVGAGGSYAFLRWGSALMPTETETAPAAVAEAPASPTASDPEAATTGPDTSAGEVTPPVDATTDAERIAYVRQLEVRGVNTRTGRILVYHPSSGQTQGFGEGDYLDGPLGLRFERIEESNLVFIDPNGIRYVKSF